MKRDTPLRLWNLFTKGFLILAVAGLLVVIGAQFQRLALERAGWGPAVEAEYDLGGVPRFRVTHRDTLDDGLVVRTVEDLLWHEVRLYALWDGREYLGVAVRR